jgi:transposase
MECNAMKRAPNPPYSPDLAPSDFIFSAMLRENFADSDTDPRRSHLSFVYIDVNSIPLSIVETFSINQRSVE